MNIMYPNPCKVFPCSNHGSYSFYCTVCKQRFQTEKNFKRHNNSRKHTKQIQFMEGNVSRMEQTLEQCTDFDLLPNDIIEHIISDLAGQVFEKDTFFNDIQLLEKNDLDSPMTSPKQASYLPTSPHARMEYNPIVYRPNQPSVRRIPAIYPCLTCFQLLDSQENFDAHMLKAHFNGSYGAMKEL